MKKITDKQRLDWLNRNGTIVWCWTGNRGWSVNGVDKKFKTVRQAIDEAIRNTTKGVGG